MVRSGGGVGSKYARPKVPNAYVGAPEAVQKAARANALRYQGIGQGPSKAVLTRGAKETNVGGIGLPAVDLALGLLGTSRKQIAFAAQHPIARAQDKGPFAPTRSVKINGQQVPLEGTAGFPFPGGKNILSRAGEEGASTLKNAKVTFSGHVPRVPKGTATPETGGALGQQVREGLRGAKQARTAQEKLYTAERGKRAREAAAAMQEQGGQAGYQAALGKLKGELPKLEFNGMKNFDQAGIDSLFTHIQAHPTLRTYEKIRAQKALLNVLSGRVPTRSELNLMEQAFGREVSGRIAASVPFWLKAKNIGLELINVPRSLMASFDLSAPFRQGLVSGVKYPRMFFKNFGPMVKAFGSERVYQGIMEDIHSRPTFPKMQEAGLSLTDLEQLTTREEQFVSNLAERIPVVGRGVRASGRAYTGFLTKMRADIFDYLLHSAEAQGLDTTDEKLLTSIARYVNSATGRGDLGVFQKHAVTLNSLFFSPRLLASRLNFLNPVYYARLDPFARKEALKAARNLVGILGLTLFLAKQAGAEVNADPRNADFAKIRFGNTRIDVLGGFQQPVRLLAQLFSGKVISSTTGKTLTLGPQGPGKLSRRDIVQRFFEAKLAPTPSFVNDWFKGTDFADKPFSWKKAVLQRMTPLLAQDAADLYNQEGSLPLAVGGYALGSLGFGIQTYAPPKPKKSTKRTVTYGNTGSSGGSSYARRGSSGGSAYAGK